MICAYMYSIYDIFSMYIYFHLYLHVIGYVFFSQTHSDVDRRVVHAAAAVFAVVRGWAADPHVVWVVSCCPLRLGSNIGLSENGVYIYIYMYMYIYIFINIDIHTYIYIFT